MEVLSEKVRVKPYLCNLSTLNKQAISARKWVLCELTVCFDFQSRSERTFRVTTDLLNTENLKVAFAQLCNELKGCNFTVV